MTWEPLFALVPPVGGISLGAGMLMAVAAVAGLLPLRGGAGQHAQAGPGALNVWQLYDVVERAAVSEPEPEEVVWPPPSESPPGGSFLGESPSNEHETARPRRDWPPPLPESVWQERLADAPRVLRPGELWDEPLPKPPPRPDAGEREYVGRHRLIQPLDRLHTDLVLLAP